MKKIIVVIFFTVCSNAFAQEMITDRPDQTESSSMVKPGLVQIESGFVYEKDNDENIENIMSPSALARIGLLQNLEFRIGIDYMQSKQEMTLLIFPPQNVTTKVSGFGPLSIGTKIGIAKEKELLPEMALITHLTIPKTGSENFQTNNISSEIRFTFSNTLSERFSLGYNLGFEWDGNSSESTGIYTIALGGSITNKLGFFTELYGFFPEGNVSIHYADGGFTYKILPNLQLDVSGGIGLTEEANDYFIGSGISFRLPR